MDEIGIRKWEISCKHLTQLTKLNHMNETKCKVDTGSIERVSSLNQNFLKTSSEKRVLCRKIQPATARSAN